MTEQHSAEKDAAYWQARAERAEARLRSRYCGCGWCCANTPPKQRGEMHKRTCVTPPAKTQAS
jgi:hypothetical protein